MATSLCVRTKYYKQIPALAVLDHAESLRNGFTRSVNVIPEYSHLNVGKYYHSQTSSLAAFNFLRDKYKEVTGKKCRSDFNALFEHVVVFPEEQYSKIEKKHGEIKAKEALLRHVDKYAKEIQKEFGFSLISSVIHFDEGHVSKNTDNKRGSIKRNLHAHVFF